MALAAGTVAVGMQVFFSSLPHDLPSLPELLSFLATHGQAAEHMYGLDGNRIYIYTWINSSKIMQFYLCFGSWFNLNFGQIHDEIRGDQWYLIKYYSLSFVLVLFDELSFQYNVRAKEKERKFNPKFFLFSWLISCNCVWRDTCHMALWSWI